MGELCVCVRFFLFANVLYNLFFAFFGLTFCKLLFGICFFLPTLFKICFLLFELFCLLILQIAFQSLLFIFLVCILLFAFVMCASF